MIQENREIINNDVRDDIINIENNIRNRIDDFLEDMSNITSNIQNNQSFFSKNVRFYLRSSNIYNNRYNKYKCRNLLYIHKHHKK